MKDIGELHRCAMELAEEGFLARMKGNLQDASELLRRAFEHEKTAADSVAVDAGAEPTRSVLHRSAASLAIDCGEYREAERLIAVAISGSPPSGIAEELRDLLQQVYFHRHLDLRGLALDPSELQFSMSGKAIGHGIAPSTEFVERVENAEKLIRRTAERVKGLSYREGGRPSRQVAEGSELFVSQARAGSFAVTFRIGRPKEQLSFLAEPSVAVVDELLSNLELFSNYDDDGLKRSIPDPAYFRNFMGLARALAPDGANVALVGFTAVREGKERQVALTRTQDKVSLVEPLPAQGEGQAVVRVEGRLLYADSTHKTGEIKLVEESGKKHKVKVPEGMMSDIVKPLWEDVVIVDGIRVRKVIELKDIRKAEA